MKEYAWTDHPDDELWRNGRFGTIEECMADMVEIPGKEGQDG